MRASVPFLVLLAAFGLFVSACGGPDDAERKLAEACDRQIQELNEEDDSQTPSAKSTEDALADQSLHECAGQKQDGVADDTQQTSDSESSSTGGSDGEGSDDDTAADGGKGSGQVGDGAAAGADAGSGAAGGSDDGAGTTPVALDPDARDSFSQTCGGCHTLADAKTTGAVGPNLDTMDLSADEIEAQIEHGGGGMPPNLLQGEDATKVAQYVAAAASGG